MGTEEGSGVGTLDGWSDGIGMGTEEGSGVGRMVGFHVSVVGM